MPETDARLARRAAAGDERAFEVLLDRHRTQLRNVAASFVDELIDLDETWSIVVERVWREILRGTYNPARATFGSFASMAAHEALVADWRRRHTRSRWPDQAPTSFELLDGYEQPAWSFGADPLQIVLWREALREAVRSLTELQLAAVNRYLQTDGVGASSRHVDAMYNARKHARAAMAGAVV